MAIVDAPEELRPLLDVLHEGHPNADLADVRRAYGRARELHAGQMRKSGEPFVSHPLAVARILADLGMDTITIVAALLHDAVEDTDLSLEQLRTEFGDEVAELVDGLTKIAKIGFRSREQREAENYRKMMVAMAQDVRVIIVKLADRLDNLRTLDALTREKQELKASETLEIYVPLANRLGMAQMKTELEDLAFRYLYPKRCEEVVELTERRQPERDSYVESVAAQIRDALTQANIKADVSGRAKNVYSIYQKMVERDREFDEIYDLVGVRIVVDTMNDCYTALGVVHALWKPLPGRFKDYIAMPKFNMYQSLHTTVIGPQGKPLEIQIRTLAMHRMAEYGIAAHWRYKDGEAPGVAWIGEFADLTEATRDPREFMETLRLDLFHDEVFVFTPKGDVQCLPRGASPLDFAYAVHTEVGHRTVGARVNGKLVPLDTRLESGDVVEVLTTRAPEAHPKQDWLAFVRTSRARSKIRQWFAAHRREEAREQGRELFVKTLRREGIASAAVGDEQWRAMLSDTKTAGPDVLYEALGEGRISQAAFTQVLRRVFKPADVEQPPERDRPPLRRSRRHDVQSVVVVDGAEDVAVKLSGCCAPMPGDEIFGFVTLGKGVSVHRVDCPNAKSLRARPERVMPVRWDTSHGGRFVVVLQVVSIDRVGLLRDISNAITEAGVNIANSSTGSRKDGTSQMRFTFELGDVAHLDHIVANVRRVGGVFDVFRVLPLEGRR